MFCPQLGLPRLVQASLTKSNVGRWRTRLLYHRGFKIEPFKELGLIQKDLSTPVKQKNYGKDGKKAGTESEERGMLKVEKVARQR